MNKEELKNTVPLLELLTQVCDKDRLLLLKFLNCEACFAIYECIHNSMWNKVIPMKRRKLLQKIIRKEGKSFLFLNSKRTSSNNKHKHLLQVGSDSGFNIILKSLLPILKQYLKENE
jgi:hypothetical protein